MKNVFRYLSSLWAVGLLFAGTPSAQTATFPYDHIHLNVPDAAVASAWYEKYFGGKRITEAPNRIMYGSTRLMFLVKKDALPSAGGAIDHLGFSVPDLDAKMKEFEAAGIKIVNPVRDVPGLFKLAFIEDPFGTKIELVQDPDTPGFHHIHLRLPDPDKALAWYGERFGGERAKLKGRIDGLRYTDGLWLLVQKADGAPPSSGRAIDHVGWRVRDIDAFFAGAKGRGDKIAGEPRPIRDLRAGFIADPNGVRIEIAQRPKY